MHMQCKCIHAYGRSHEPSEDWAIGIIIAKNLEIIMQNVAQKMAANFFSKNSPSQRENWLGLIGSGEGGPKKLVTKDWQKLCSQIGLIQ